MIRVLQFSGKESEWNMWSKKFLATARKRGYKSILENKEKLPDASEDIDVSTAEGLAKTKVREANENAYTDLMLACVDDISFGIVEMSVTVEQPEGDARLAWKRLYDKYEPSTGASKIELKAEFAQLKLECVADDPDEWVTKLERIRHRLRTMKSIISEEDLLIHILNNLPKEYESTIETAEKDLNDGTLSIESLRTIMRARYNRMKKYEK